MAHEQSEERNCCYVVADIRGFTAWMSANDLFVVARLIPSLWRTLSDLFPRSNGHHIKLLGDGGLIVTPSSGKKANRQLRSILDSIAEAERCFGNECRRVGDQLGCDISLNLGWGVSRGLGLYFPQFDDYLSQDVNKAARLVAVARPHGVIVDREDFPTLPSEYRDRFRQSTVVLNGVGPCKAWLSEEVTVEDSAWSI
jgi:class 3 adenylate cyclase